MKILKTVVFFLLCHTVFVNGNQFPLLRIHEKPKLIYYMIPKNGINSVNFVLSCNGIAYKLHLSIDLDNYKDYFKFTFVRNPWDRVVSAYENLVVANTYGPFSHLKGKGFDDFVFFLASQDLHVSSDPHIRLQTALLPNLDELDFIGRFENLSNDLTKVLNILDLKRKDIPQLNKSDHPHYSLYYNEITKAIISEKYKEDIEFLGYQFEDQKPTRI